MSKIIAVIGATGAQGLPSISNLLASGPDGSPSPWKVRALTRNPNGRRAKELEALGAELVVGSFLDLDVIHKLLDGAYGAFVNTDGNTVGDAAELLAAFNIWEIANLHKVRHFVWSNLDYALPLGKYKSIYAVDHYNTKGRFAAFLAAQPNRIDDPEATLWSVFTNGPYMDMIWMFWGPSNIREDGTRVWVSPIGKTGTVPMIALEDLGWWTRYIFDNVESTSGKDLQVASQMASIHDVMEAFKTTTGLPTEMKELSMDDYFKLWNGTEVPMAANVPNGKTWEENFRGFMALWRDNVVSRDMEWVNSIHPPTTLEKWMRDRNYDGGFEGSLLKVMEDGVLGLRPIFEETAKL